MTIKCDSCGLTLDTGRDAIRPDQEYCPYCKGKMNKDKTDEVEEDDKNSN